MEEQLVRRFERARPNQLWQTDRFFGAAPEVLLSLVTPTALVECCLHEILAQIRDAFSQAGFSGTGL
jgi:hypothetical protein